MEALIYPSPAMSNVRLPSLDWTGMSARGASAAVTMRVVQSARTSRSAPCAGAELGLPLSIVLCILVRDPRLGADVLIEVLVEIGGVERISDCSHARAGGDADFECGRSGLCRGWMANGAGGTPSASERTFRYKWHLELARQ